MEQEHKTKEKMRSRSKDTRIMNTIIFLICLIVAFSMLIPFVWMVSSSFKENKSIFSVPIEWIPTEPTLANYNTIINKIPFLTYFFNTAKISVIVTGLQIITSSMAAFAFAKLHFPGRDKLFLLYLGTMMVPWYAIMIPQFIIIQKMHLYDTHWALILTGAFSVFGVFILRQNMISIPDSLGEAAKIDGCGPAGIFMKIILPLSKTGIATLAILTFNNVWNDYMGPMIYLDTDTKKTIQLGLATFKRQFDANYGAIMAGTVISLIPVVMVYIFAQRYIVEGVAFSGVKG